MSDTPRTEEFDARQQRSDHRYDWAERHSYLLDFARELERDVEEQLRFNAMGSEREARLMAKVAEMERENAILRAMVKAVLADVQDAARTTVTETIRQKLAAMDAAKKDLV